MRFFPFKNSLPKDPIDIKVGKVNIETDKQYSRTLTKNSVNYFIVETEYLFDL